MTGPVNNRSSARPDLERVQRIGERAKDALETANEVRKELTEIPEQLRNLRRDGFSRSTRSNWAEAAQSARNPTSPFGFSQITRAYGAVTGAFRLPGQVLATGRSIRDAVRNPSQENVTAATNSSIDTSRAAVTTVAGGLQTVRDVQRGRAAYRAADTAIRQAAPDMAPSVRRAATRAATRTAFTGAAPRAIAQATRTAAERAIQRSGATVAEAVTSSTSRTLARQTLARTSGAAARATAPAVARAATSTVARAAGRFVPGVNVAMAVADTAQFYSDMRNPNASTGTRISSAITALGSVAAATNIPVVSQVGGAVAAVGGFARGLFGG